MSHSLEEAAKEEEENADEQLSLAMRAQVCTTARMLLQNTHRWNFFLVFLLWRCAIPTVWLINLGVCALTTRLSDAVALSWFNITRVHSAAAGGEHYECATDLAFHMTSVMCMLLCYCIGWIYQACQRSQTEPPLLESIEASECIVIDGATRDGKL